MKLGSNITFILKEPSGKLHYSHIDSCREPLDRPHKFKICPSNISESLNVSDDTSFKANRGMSDFFSIKNNCRTPYCSKLVSDWTPFPNENITTLAYVSIPRRLFDPIMDPDLIDFYSRSHSLE